MSLSRDVAYIHYAANKARVQNAMKRLDESNKVFTEDQINQIILEEFNNTDTMNKLTQVFTNMTNKFVEYTKKQIQNKHNEIYLKAIQPKVTEIAKGKNIPLEMLDYEKGIANIDNINNLFSKFQQNLYDQVKADNKDACIANIQKALFNDFNPQGNIKFDQFCLNYFQGGIGTAQKLNTNVNALKMDQIVNWCLNFPQKLSQANHDKDTILALIGKSVQGVGNMQGTTQPTAPQTTAQPAPTTQSNNESIDYSKADIRHKAYQYKNILEDIFNEADDTQNSNVNNTQTTAQPASNTTNNNGQKDSTNTNAQNPQKDNTNNNEMKIDNQATKEEQKKDASVGIYMGAIQNVATAIINARLRSLNIIYNDYIKILQAVCPRSEYMNNQQQGQQPAQPVAQAQPAQPAVAAQGQGQPAPANNTNTNP